MPIPSFLIKHPALLPASVLLGLLLTACSSPPPSLPAEAPLRQQSDPDFSGHWEKDYRLSDDFNTRFSLYIADIQRRYNSPQSNSDIQAVVAAGMVRSEAINGLARFAEELTRMPLLDISQQSGAISIQREGDFTLRCQYQDRQYRLDDNPFGSDVCGWNNDRLLFRMNLRDGLDITHQFSLSADHNMLDVTTTVHSAVVAAPITIRNVYRRYEFPEQDYECRLTLTRQRVCSQRGLLP